MQRFRFWLALTGLLTLTAGPALAQNCRSYYHFKEGGTIEMTITNKKGKVTGKQIIKPTSVRTVGGATVADVNAQMVNEKGKQLAVTQYQAKCSGNKLEVDMRTLVPVGAANEQTMGMDAKLTGDNLVYPSNMSPGMRLPDGTLQVSAGQGGTTLGGMTLSITERQVVAKESVTTAGGTWQCFKITSHTKYQMSMGPMNLPARNIDQTEWFAPGFGLVKTESEYGKTEITSVR